MGTERSQGWALHRFYYKERSGKSFFIFSQMKIKKMALSTKNLEQKDEIDFLLVINNYYWSFYQVCGYKFCMNYENEKDS